ncbi:MAG: hypothetical protein ACKO4A_14935 [Gammaproteobacteria bacterium]
MAAVPRTITSRVFIVLDPRKPSAGKYSATPRITCIRTCPTGVDAGFGGYFRVDAGGAATEQCAHSGLSRGLPATGDSRDRENRAIRPDQTTSLSMISARQAELPPGSVSDRIRQENGFAAQTAQSLAMSWASVSSGTLHGLHKRFDPEVAHGKTLGR